MEKERFEELVAQALDGVPTALREKMENVAIMVQDWPTPRQLREAEIRNRQDLFGLYEGIPLPKRSSGYNMVLPDQITIFQKAIEMHCRTDGRIIRKIRGTLHHEIAHYFGISDARLREIGRY